MKTLSQVCSLLVSCLKISLSLLAGKQKLMTESLVKTRQHFRKCLEYSSSCLFYCVFCFHFVLHTVVGDQKFTLILLMSPFDEESWNYWVR